MNWNVAVFGKLAFPRGGRTSWHTQQVDASRFRDWVDEFDGGHLDPATVADVLAAIAAFPGDVNAPGRIDLASTATGVSILGYLEDDGYRSWCAQLAALFRVAADAGGAGDLWFVDAAGQAA